MIKYLGKFDNWIPGSISNPDAKGGDILFIKSSAYADTWTLHTLDSACTFNEDGSWEDPCLQPFPVSYPRKHSMYTLIFTYKEGVKTLYRVNATSYCARYSSGRAFSHQFNTEEEAQDFIITNYLRHVSGEFSGHSVDFHEYKGAKYFSKQTASVYISGVIKPNKKLYLKNSHGKAIISGTKIDISSPEKLVALLKTLFRLKPEAGVFF